MSESTADADLRWREKELRAAWEMGRSAAVRRIHDHWAFTLRDDQLTDYGRGSRDGLHRVSSEIGGITPPDNLGDLVKEKTGER